jgi:hypothetical protein
MQKCLKNKLTSKQPSSYAPYDQGVSLYTPGTLQDIHSFSRPRYKSINFITARAFMLRRKLKLETLTLEHPITKTGSRWMTGKCFHLKLHCDESYEIWVTTLHRSSLSFVVLHLLTFPYTHSLIKDWWLVTRHWEKENWRICGKKQLCLNFRSALTFSWLDRGKHLKSSVWTPDLWEEIRIMAVRNEMQWCSSYGLILSGCTMKNYENLLDMWDNLSASVHNDTNRASERLTFHCTRVIYLPLSSPSAHVKVHNRNNVAQLFLFLVYLLFSNNLLV